MSVYNLGDVIWEEFVISSSTGAATNADTLPISTLVRNGSDDTSVTVRTINLDTGRYVSSGVVPASYNVGDRIDIYVSGTVSSIVSKAILALGKIGPIKADTVRWSGVAIASPDTNGYPKVTHKVGVSAGEINIVAGIPLVNVVLISGSNIDTRVAQIGTNTVAWSGATVTGPRIAGIPIVDIGYAAGSVVTLTSGNVDVNVVQWSGVNLPPPDTNGYVKATIKSGTGAGEMRLNAGILSSVIVASSGLDVISVADPGGVSSMTTVPKMLVALWRRAFKKNTMTSTQMKDYADDGTTVNVTSTLTDDGTTQTKGAGT